MLHELTKIVNVKLSRIGKIHYRLSIFIPNNSPSSSLILVNHLAPISVDFQRIICSRWSVYHDATNVWLVFFCNKTYFLPVPSIFYSAEFLPQCNLNLKEDLVVNVVGRKLSMFVLHGAPCFPYDERCDEQQKVMNTILWL